MITAFRKLISKEVSNTIPADDILARQRYALFRVFSLTGSLLLCFFAYEESSLHSFSEARIFTYSAIAATLMINFIGLQFHRNFVVAYVISIIAVLSLIHGVSYYNGGVRNPDFFFMGSVILYSYIILENKGGRITLFLSLFNVIYFYALTDFTLPGEYITWNLDPRSIDGKYLYTAITSMVIMTSLSAYLAYSKNAVINKIEESKTILIKKNEELEELSLVASETINSVVITDKNGVIEWVNAGFTRLTGFKPEEATGKKPTTFLYGPESDLNKAKELELLNFPGNTFDTEIIKYKKDGTVIWVQENVTRIHDEVENVTKYIFIESDITERKKSEERMADYLKNLEKTNKELDKFAYVVSHDLKAPLRAIGNLTGWIEEDAGHMLPEEVRKNFNLIKERVVRMEALINGILDYSKVAKKNNQIENFNLNILLNETIELLGNPADCIFTIDTNLPSIQADKIKIQQIFMNLIGNAIKFNTNTEKRIKITSIDLIDYYQFSISDNGPGIDPRFHDKIFMIFQTLHSRDEFESTGVGLAIVKKIIDEQNGKIWVDSSPGKGSTFHFTWPKSDMVFVRTRFTEVQRA